jgi:predicted NUDIX family NTP pyrophosphohydrolase
MEKHSAGLLMFRRREKHLEVFLVHPGGPRGLGRFLRVNMKKDKILRMVPSENFETKQESRRRESS